MSQRIAVVLILASGLLLSALPVSAQSFVLDLPRGSQHATVSQRVGITDIAISYHRPLVNRSPRLGEVGSVRTSLARRSEREHDHLIQRSCHH